MRRESKKQDPKRKGPMLDVHTNEDVKRYIGAISEHFGGQISAVAEQFLGLNDKIDDLGKNLNTKIDAVESGLTKKISAVEGGLGSKFDNLSKELVYMKEDLDIVKTSVEIIKSGLTRKVDYQDFEALEKRVRLVEAKLRR